ncbi:hypothetical protein SPFL3102_00582 [Sporomusaceae bacterium FL31]|nr:hypothetical protein SPFL3101_01369 [Sporomusaceae bacterium FL31]GCE32786.1 hypothetical protein SPFL3102_00582 [Sporomusaceae bacterium]
MKVGVHVDGLIAEIGNCCLSDLCSECKQEQCLIGYCKKSLTATLKQNSEFIDGGMTCIPLNDTKIYENDAVVGAIGFLLNQCRNCNVYHDDECIINIVRSSLEVILFGEFYEYKGSTLMYLNDIKSRNSELAGSIFASFSAKKN